MRPKSLISLKTSSKELSMTLAQALTVLWYLATYPLQLLAIWYFFGSNGVTLALMLFVLRYRFK